MDKNIVLLKPYSLENEADGAESVYVAPNLTKRLLSLFKNLRPGSDLIRFQMPATFNLPKSTLQVCGEFVYSTASDVLSKCNKGHNSLERFISVVAWSISTTRPPADGIFPYDPILGETHHVSKGNLNVLLEQISLKPSVTALHATDEKENIEIIWCQYPIPKFHGASVEGHIHGKRKLKLLNHEETYEMNSPHILIRLLPIPGSEWVGNVNIQCLETGLVAELCYKSQSILGFRGNRRLIKGKIIDSSSRKVLYEINGHWDSTVTLKDTNNAEVRVIHNAKEVILGLQAPIVKDVESVWPTESAVIWSEVNQAILSKDWEKATKAKKAVEEAGPKGETWAPKHFTVSQTNEGDWECLPIEQWVPASPIVTS